MKKIIILLLLTSLRGLGQNEFKYCELVGVQKGIFNNRLVVAVDSGGGRFDYKAIQDTVEVEKAAEYKNEKVYVTTDAAMYEGKTVQSDAKGKYIWKKVEINPVSTEKKLKAKIFNSMIDGMNYMGKDGWEFVQAYVITTPGTSSNVYHWLLKKRYK